MGWDFFTYELQPPFFLDEIKIFLFQENEAMRSTESKMKPVGKGKGYSRYG